MPMFEFFYKPQRVSRKGANIIGKKLEAALREAIKLVRPKKGEYRVTVEGRPFGPIIENQPDLLIHIFYHVEWGFNADELGLLVVSMSERVSEILQDALVFNIEVRIRFYVRPGYAGSTFNVLPPERA